MQTKLLELHCILRLYDSNFLNLHWNAAGKEFNDAHKSISTDYYELCEKYIDSTAEMLARLEINAPNYMEVCDILQNTESNILVVESGKFYDREDIIKLSDIMLRDVLKLIEVTLQEDLFNDISNVGIKSDLEAMHSEFDLQYRYINKRKMM